MHDSVQKKLMLLEPVAQDRIIKFLALLDDNIDQFSAYLGVSPELISFPVLAGWRSDAEQVATYAQGRQSLEEVNNLRTVAGLYPLKSQSGTVTNCDGVKNKSMHQLGKAADIGIAINDRVLWDYNDDWGPQHGEREAWEHFGYLARQARLTWGGMWGKTASRNGWDCPHVEIA